MPTKDPAKAIKDSLAAAWATNHDIVGDPVPHPPHPTWTATLHVDDNYRPTLGSPVVLVASDGGPPIIRGEWAWGHPQPDGYAAPYRKRSAHRPVMRMTAFAKGRAEARSTIDEAVDWIVANRPAEISRIEDISEPLITRDRETGAYLASVTMPVIVKPFAA